MEALKRIRVRFEPHGLLLFALVMLPNIIWFFYSPANDILRMESTTPMLDAIVSVTQALMVALCAFKLSLDRGEGDRFSKEVSTASKVIEILFVKVYYIFWVIYYLGYASWPILLGLAAFPCAAFLTCAISRKNMPAIVFATAFAALHVASTLINFIFI